MPNAMRYVSLLPVVLFCLHPAFAADKVLLTNNTTLDGEVIRDVPGEDEVVIAASTRNLSVARKDIKNLRLDEEARKELAARRARITPPAALPNAGLPPASPAPEEGVVIGLRGSGAQPADTGAAAHFELYNWAKAQHLYGAAQEELLATIAADPNHAEAHKALGNVFREGQWFAATEGQAPASASAPAAPGGSAQKEEVAFYNQVAQACKTLAPTSSAPESEKSAVASELSRQRSRASGMLACCLSPVNQPEPASRLGALKGVELLKPRDTTISFALGAAAASDPAKEVRSAAVALVKARNDDFGIRTMIGHLLSSYDSTGKVRNKELHDNAVGALHELNDKRVIQALLYYVTMELRLASVSEGSLVTRQIDSYSVNSGANVNVLVPLSFPIQFPELKIARVQTTVMAPAINSLRDLTGQDFGADWEKWNKWWEKQR